MKSAFKNFFFLLILYYFRRNLELGLEILSLMPRTIVVLVGNPDFSRLQVLKDRSLHCATYLSVLCSCLSSNTVNRFKWLVYSFNNVLKNIAHSPRFQRADFTVEYVPAATNLLNRVSQNMFALDCLHYNKATQNQVNEFKINRCSGDCIICIRCITCIICIICISCITCINCISCITSINYICCIN
ncbi:uncharacterized protein LOC111696870 isoform X1 [Eurytemora carolleeae]|uniref:uncharacterized protein LOC111696870 isoform X1 n=1 Tax=Eurytemora carolleeae TaxID=1294199 RepID=UPI000C75A928|nr:uncharacterized protein LOC111696870 isoform X1 [Eurytemora carolleeae]|eukprot:XP_023322392.1 uncharacterized protein LOC111696870 isoform X1 [Eurytemora affinis]